MADYIACRPCRFGGVDYKTGDRIPGDKVIKKRAGELINMKYIKPAPAEPEKATEATEATEPTEATVEPEKAQTKRTRTSKK